MRIRVSHLSPVAPTETSCGDLSANRDAGFELAHNLLQYAETKLAISLFSNKPYIQRQGSTRPKPSPREVGTCLVLRNVPCLRRLVYCERLCTIISTMNPIVEVQKHSSEGMSLAGLPILKGFCSYPLDESLIPWPVLPEAFQRLHPWAPMLRRRCLWGDVGIRCWHAVFASQLSASVVLHYPRLLHKVDCNGQHHGPSFLVA